MERIHAHVVLGFSEYILDVIPPENFVNNKVFVLIGEWGETCCLAHL